MEGVEAREIHIASIIHVERPAFRRISSIRLTSDRFPSETSMKLGMGRAESQQRMHLQAPLVRLNGAQYEGQSQFSGCSIQIIDRANRIHPRDSSAYIAVRLRFKTVAKSAYMRQSMDSLRRRA